MLSKSCIASRLRVLASKAAAGATRFPGFTAPAAEKLNAKCHEQLARVEWPTDAMHLRGESTDASNEAVSALLQPREHEGCLVYHTYANLNGPSARPSAVTKSADAASAVCTGKNGVVTVHYDAALRPSEARVYCRTGGASTWSYSRVLQDDGSSFVGLASTHSGRFVTLYSSSLGAFMAPSELCGALKDQRQLARWQVSRVESSAKTESGLLGRTDFYEHTGNVFFKLADNRRDGSRELFKLSDVGLSEPWLGSSKMGAWKHAFDHSRVLNGGQYVIEDVEARQNFVVLLLRDLDNLGNLVVGAVELHSSPQVLKQLKSPQCTLAQVVAPFWRNEPAVVLLLEHPLLHKQYVRFSDCLSRKHGVSVAVDKGQFKIYPSSNCYCCERIAVKTNRAVTLANCKKLDLIPVTLLAKKGVLQGLQRPKGVLLRVYGAYGTSIDIVYQPEHHWLLDQNWVVATAHVRGGGELGPCWHAAGRGAYARRFAVYDFLNVARYLKSKFRTHVCASAFSAGAVIAASAAIKKPHLIKSVVLHSPFLDVVRAMSSSKAALTLGEYGEWGNPKDLRQKRYMKGYSPMSFLDTRKNRITFRNAQSLPHLYVLAGAKDKRTPVRDTLRFAKKYKRQSQNSKVSLKVVPGAMHLIGNMSDANCYHAENAEDMVLEERARELQFLMRSVPIKRRKLASCPKNTFSCG